MILDQTRSPMTEVRRIDGWYPPIFDRPSVYCGLDGRYDDREKACYNVVHSNVAPRVECYPVRVQNIATMRSYAPLNTLMSKFVPLSCHLICAQGLRTRLRDTRTSGLRKIGHLVETRPEAVRARIRGSGYNVKLLLIDTSHITHGT